MKLNRDMRNHGSVTLNHAIWLSFDIKNTRQCAELVEASHRVLSHRTNRFQITWLTIRVIRTMVRRSCLSEARRKNQGHQSHCHFQSFQNPHYTPPENNDREDFQPALFLEQEFLEFFRVSKGH